MRGCLADGSGELKLKEKDVPEARERARKLGVRDAWDFGAESGRRDGGGAGRPTDSGRLWAGSPGVAIGADELDQVREDELRSLQGDA